MLVRLNSTLRGKLGVRSISVAVGDQSDARTVLAQAVAQQPQLGALLFGEDGELLDNIVVFRNGRKLIMLDGLDTLVGPDDTLDCFPKTGVQRAFT